jgi:O-antigen ligase
VSTSTGTSTTTRATTATSTRATTDRTRPKAQRSGPSAGAGALLLTLLLAWTTFAFAGVYLFTLAIPAAICLALLIVYRPLPFPTRGGDRPAEAWIALALALTLFQLVPLPGLIVDALSPQARETWRRLALDVPRSLPLSVDVDAGLWAWLVAACTATTYVAARQIFRRGGVRTVTRAIAAIGFVVSAIALAQEASAHGLMYWRWAPIEEGAAPFGPFVNRNHFGTWVLLAAPLVFGYLGAHSAAHHRAAAAPSWRARIGGMADARTMWLIASGVMMTVALVVSLSRSALFGSAVAVLAAVWLRRETAGIAGHRPERWIAVALVLAAAVILVRVDPAALSARLATASVSAASRLAIWRDTLPVIRDFWLTGTGAGTYETVMLVYQRTTPEVRFNQAHNHYLQAAAEGGLLLAIPLLMALRAYVREAVRMLAGDRSGMYLVRAGALCGLAAVAAQSLWETGLTTPANAFLAAVLAAIVVHAPIRADRPGDA